MKFKDLHFFAPLLITVLTANAIAAETSFEYPELSVVPRATERLQTEVARERTQGWKSQLPFLVPAAVTTASGLVMLGTGTKTDTDPGNAGAQYAPWAGIGVGAAWLAVSLVVLNQSSIYEEGVTSVAALPKATQRDQLARERRAEEVIFHAGSIARRLKWLSVASQLGTGAFMAVSAKKDTLGLYMGLASAATAFTPVIFPHTWERTESLHREYKKRIYAPVLGATLLSDPNGRAVSPGLLLAFRF
jgi:hypothetical protein